MYSIADGLATCEPLHVRKISWHYFQTACLRFVGAPRAFLTRLVPTTGRRRTAARTDSRSGAPAFELKWIPLTHSMGLYIISIHSYKGDVFNCRRARHVRAPTRTENQLALFPNRLSAIRRGATCLSDPSGADHRKAQDGCQNGQP